MKSVTYLGASPWMALKTTEHTLNIWTFIQNIISIFDWADFILCLFPVHESVYQVDQGSTCSVFKKQFSCDICSASFTRRCTLKIHQRVHSGEKPYKCSKCCHNFRYYPSIQAHFGHCNGKMLCVICSEHILTFSELERHFAVCREKQTTHGDIISRANSK